MVGRDGHAQVERPHQPQRQLQAQELHQLTPSIAAGQTTTIHPLGAERTPGQVICDIHPWMTAWWMVLDNPYFAVTDENGNFEIKNVPAGTQKVVVWQEAVSKGGLRDRRLGRGDQHQGQRYDGQGFHDRSRQAPARRLISNGLGPMPISPWIVEGHAAGIDSPEWTLVIIAWTDVTSDSIGLALALLEIEMMRRTDSLPASSGPDNIPCLASAWRYSWPCLHARSGGAGRRSARHGRGRAGAVGNDQGPAGLGRRERSPPKVLVEKGKADKDPDVCAKDAADHVA